MSLDPRLQAFKDITLRHEKIKRAFEAALDIDAYFGQEKIVILTGATGVGKSTLCQRLVTEIQARFCQEMEDDPGFIPVIYVRIPAPINGDFNWKDGMIRILEQFNEPLIRRKVIQAPVIELDGEVVGRANKLVREELRRSVRNCIRHRKTKLMIIDEASHLLISKSRSFFYQQFEMIKSLSQDFGVPLLLSGAYDLLDIRDFNGQLIRRTKVIHFPRYRWEEVVDPRSAAGQSFHHVIHTLLEKMSVAKSDDLGNHVDYFYLNSLGCIGLLKDWFYDTLHLAIKHDQPISLELFEQTKRSKKDLHRISLEIKAGESRLDDGDIASLAKSLGMTTIPNPFGAPRQIASESDPVRPKGNSHPGKRKASRDLAGEQLHAE